MKFHLRQSATLIYHNSLRKQQHNREKPMRITENKTQEEDAKRKQAGVERKGSVITGRGLISLSLFNP